MKKIKLIVSKDQGSIKTDALTEEILQLFDLELDKEKMKFKEVKLERISSDTISNDIEFLKDVYSNCNLCINECHKNRMVGERGVCDNDADGHIYINQLEYGEEKMISPSYMIYFTGCNIKCDFCHQKDNLTYHIGNEYINYESVIDDISKKQNEITTISFLGGNPDQSLLGILQFIKKLNDQNIYLPLVWNSNLTHQSFISDIINRYFDIFIPDIKFGNDECAYNIAKTKKYVDVVLKNILCIESSYPIIIRHLPLPGHLKCCSIMIIDFLNDISKEKIIIVTILPSLFSDNNFEYNYLRNILKLKHNLTEENLCQ